MGKDEGKKKEKGGGGKTVSSVYLVSLGELMETLHACEPHFVRCLVPNTHKTPGMVEPLLIMHQLQCNGVLEGIRICMRGFPTECCILISNLDTKSLEVQNLLLLMTTRPLFMHCVIKLDLEERGTDWVTLSSSSELELLHSLRRSEMILL